MKRGRLRRHRKGQTVSGRPNLGRTQYKDMVLDLTRRCGGRCEDPWCRIATFLDPHHVVKRSQGGPDTQDNLVMLCRSSHQDTDLPKSDDKYLHVIALHEEVFLFIREDRSISYSRPRPS
jgi:5-methylcytosine-specific restriction endonuclease McrA